MKKIKLISRIFERDFEEDIKNFLNSNKEIIIESSHFNVVATPTGNLLYTVLFIYI